MVSYCFEIPLGQSKSISCFMDFLNTVDIILKKRMECTNNIRTKSEFTYKSCIGNYRNKLQFLVFA